MENNTTQQPIDEPLEVIKDKLRRAMAELAEYFMSKPDRGNQIPMPADFVRAKLDELDRDMKLYANSSKTSELNMADDRLASEFGEDWLAYRDVRGNELSLERADLHDSIPPLEVS